jgi:2-dehydro-3-deoxyphosphogluconate aldolase/(4S)-4-hydroxy-2-oxoglutarate aldolase
MTGKESHVIEQEIARCGVVPIASVENADDIVPLCDALKKGGLEIVEITLRSAAALDAIRIAARKFPEFILGAGTVLSADDLEAVRDSGAVFAVSPGLDAGTTEKAGQLSFPFFPGVCTPTDVQSAAAMGCRIMKYFPAAAMGGVSVIKAIYTPLSHLGIRFIPTGGIKAENMTEYLIQPAVLAVGGSWITPRHSIRGGNWAEITRLAAEALSLASRSRA